MDVQRTMEFILEQQAAFAAGLISLQTKTDQLAKNLTNLAGTVEQVARMQQNHDRLISALEESQLRLEAELKASHQMLAEKHAQSEDKLNALIDVVDRLFPRQ